jgi:hypothetical protein
MTPTPLSDGFTRRVPLARRREVIPTECGRRRRRIRVERVEVAR